MWSFNAFSKDGNSQELEAAKVLLDNWFQDLKIKTTKWRVPQDIWRSLLPIAHILLELDRTAVWYMQGDVAKAKSLDSYPSVKDIFAEVSR